jgi:hypothetical protein
MILSFTLAGHDYRFDATAPIDISIPLDFHGEQPNAFHLPAATASAVEEGGFIGDTRRGGSCNCETVTLNPHGNGTHTEGIGHLTDVRLAVARLVGGTLVPATLLSVMLDRDESMPEGDAAITLARLREGLEAIGGVRGGFHRALVIRTLPNDRAKLSRRYSGGNPPYVTASAMRAIRELGADHLLLDLPSVDREDDGALTAHRIFWEMRESGNDDRVDGRHRTITEMAFVADAIEDGPYMLDLQIPALVLDAVPSRPLLYSVTAA